MAAIMALMSQVSALSSQFSTYLECLENPAQSYLPLEPAAPWHPTPSHLSKPDTNFQTGLPNPDILSQQVDFTWDMDKVADFEDYSTCQPKDQVLAHEVLCSMVLCSWGTWLTFFFLFLFDMYLYEHMISTHMTAYLYNSAILSGTSLFPPFVCSLLSSSYGSP